MKDSYLTDPFVEPDYSIPSTSIPTTPGSTDPPAPGGEEVARRGRAEDERPTATSHDGRGPGRDLDAGDGLPHPNRDRATGEAEAAPVAAATPRPSTPASSTPTAAPSTPETPSEPSATTAPVVLLQPADGIPPVVGDERTLVTAAAALGAGEGPLAVDAERASGYRYGQRAYLVQLRREGAGTWLVDPIACPDLTPIAEAVEGVEWILHAATQDLGCLREVGLHPSALFDTELGGRLAGLPRVGLAAVVEHYLGFSLAKEHSAVDWSTRPLPEDWLRYAALDVECLVEVRAAMAEDLRAQGKAEWARQEFRALTSFPGHPVRVDPWRRISGLRRIRHPRMAALVRELWYARDELAREHDVSPGRVAPDAVLVALIGAAPTDVASALRASSHRSVKRYARTWVEAVRRAEALADSELPPASLPALGPPPAKSWPDRDPVAAERLTRAREELGRFAQEHRLPVENVLTPDTLRRVLWAPPPEPSEAAIREALLDRGARPWQVEVAGPLLARIIDEVPAS